MNDTERSLWQFACGHEAVAWPPHTSSTAVQRDELCDPCRSKITQPPTPAASRHETPRPAVVTEPFPPATD